MKVYLYTADIRYCLKAVLSEKVWNAVVSSTSFLHLVVSPSIKLVVPKLEVVYFKLVCKAGEI